MPSPVKYLSQIPLIGIIRGAQTSQVESAVKSAMEGGFRTLEITLNRPEAFEQIAMLKAKLAGQIDLGAGTVLDAENAKKAIAAGAEFIVTPALLPEVAELCKSQSVPFFPGALTPTEILAGHRMGAEMVKVFPISSLGPEYIRSLKGPFPELKMIPTGGVNLKNAAEFFKAGAAALGIGGELFKRDWLERGDWALLKEAARAYVTVAKGAR